MTPEEFERLCQCCEEIIAELVLARQEVRGIFESRTPRLEPRAEVLETFETETVNAETELVKAEMPQAVTEAEWCKIKSYLRKLEGKIARNLALAFENRADLLELKHRFDLLAGVSV